MWVEAEGLGARESFTGDGCAGRVCRAINAIGGEGGDDEAGSAFNDKCGGEGGFLIAPA